MFRGQFSHTIDSKGRVSIPSGYRLELEKRGGQAPILTGDQGCLVLYPYEDWVDFESKILGASSTNPRARKYARLKISTATEAPIDGQGRILVPPFLRERAALEKDVMIAGVGNWIELWDKTRFESELSDAQENFDEYASTMSDLGT